MEEIGNMMDQTTVLANLGEADDLIAHLRARGITLNMAVQQRDARIKELEAEVEKLKANGQKSD